MNASVKPLAALLIAGAMTLGAGTPMSKAAKDGNLDAVTACLKGGESPNELDKWGWTPLMWAIYYRQTPVTLYLLDHGADPNVAATDSEKGFKKGNTALMVAAYYGLEEETTALMAKGAKPGMTDASERTALSIAQGYGFTTVVDIMNGKKQAPAEAAPFEAGVNLQPLDQTFHNLAVEDLTTSAQLAKDYPGLVQECQHLLLDDLNQKKAFQSVGLRAKDAAVAADTLVLRVEVTDIRIPSGASRFFIGPLAGPSYMHAEAKLVDGATGKVLRTQLLHTDNNLWASSISLSGHDQGLPASVAALVTAYVTTVAAPKPAVAPATAAATAPAAAAPAPAAEPAKAAAPQAPSHP